MPKKGFNNSNGGYGTIFCPWTIGRINCYNRLVELMPKRLSVKPKNLINRNRYIIKKLASVSNAERKKIISNTPSCVSADNVID